MFITIILIVADCIIIVSATMCLIQLIKFVMLLKMNISFNTAWLIVFS